MAWDDDLLPDQKVAAACSALYARLLAGPGTGKTLTLTRHVCFLVQEKQIEPTEVLAITFTRAAARELRQRVESELGSEKTPRVSTLHSFALRQLLRNAHLATNLPQPLRIADDWEERNIILEDLKKLLKLKNIRDAFKLLNELSADWQSLLAEEEEWETRFPNPQFLGGWREHRQVYGYTLRSELVYQLKKALEQHGEFELEGPIRYLLVDEYQDLNRCDLAVVRQVASVGVRLFVAGDDDQSIYGFRKAQPEGIRRFPRDYSGSRDFSLKICKRCDKKILDLGLFVARQDPRRIDKPIEWEARRTGGEVAILRFSNQDREAEGISLICQHLRDYHGLNPDEILILLRSDHDGVLSAPIRERIKSRDIPVSAITESVYPLDRENGRSMLAFLRLSANIKDHLAWRTLFQAWCDGIGQGAMLALYEIARDRGRGLADIVLSANEEPGILPNNHRTRVTTAIRLILSQLSTLFPDGGSVNYGDGDELMNVVGKASNLLISDPVESEAVVSELRRGAEITKATSIEQLVRAIEVVHEDIEQEIEEGKVNILTMHKAKGLTARAVIIAVAEDQYIPGRAEGGAVDDERRLLYVSLTRAMNHLFITYCDRRTGQQQYTGRDSGRSARSITRFLRDSIYTPLDGTTYVRGLTREQS
jgi:DNA helicase-2/ATP-dependent DNA helicase PcrA